LPDFVLSAGKHCGHLDCVRIYLAKPRKTPMKYALAVEVKLIEIEEAPEMPDFSAIRPGGDPMQAAVGVMSAIGPMLNPRPVRAFMGMPAGFDFRKETNISVPNFAALAAIIGRFDDLVADIEHEKLQV
jgi:hypothetical protein